MEVWIALITGLTTGGISCSAVQGGLLASVIANQKSKEKQSGIWATASFLVAKLVAHVILGFLLGWLGSTLTLSLAARLIFQTLAALFMLATAANLLELHPVFRFVILQPPKFLQKLVRGTSKREAIFAPALLGLFTVFIPCGITQALEVLAISSGSPLMGVALLGAFTIGTMPVFAAVGYFADALKGHWQRKFTKIAATAVTIMALSSINGVLVVLDSPITLQKITQPVTWFFSDERFLPNANMNTAPLLGQTQIAKLKVTNHGYAPNELTVRMGKPVQLTLESNETYSCALSFILKEFGVSVTLKPTDSKTISFVPNKKGNFTFSCSMGMYAGTLHVL